MTSYSLVLFVHVTAVFVLFGGLSFEAISLFHLRRASTLDEAHTWMNPVPGMPAIMVTSLLITLSTGAYLVMRVAVGEAWPKVAVAALFLIGPLGAVTARRMRAIHTVEASGKTSESALLRLLREPLLKISLGIRLAVFLGIVMLMNVQPSLWESIGIIGTAVVFGLVASLLISRRNEKLSVRNAS